jgi:hypothetical protein
MGLNIVVGITAGDEHDGVREDFAVIGRLLDRAGAGPWAEPELGEQDVLEGDMWGYSGLHALRRAAVYLAQTGALPDPLPEVRMAAGDPLLKKAGRLIT